jgi:hypothetical protein
MCKPGEFSRRWTRVCARSLAFRISSSRLRGGAVVLKSEPAVRGRGDFRDSPGLGALLLWSRRSEGYELVPPLKIGMTAYRATQSCWSRAATDVAAGGIAAAIVIRRTRISTYDGSAHRG